MFLRPGLGLLVKTVEVGVELIAIDPPYAPASQLDSRQITGTNERINLRDAHGEVGRNVLEGEEARLQRLGSGLGAFGRALCGGHLPTIAPANDRYLDLFPFAAVWPGAKEA